VLLGYAPKGAALKNMRLRRDPGGVIVRISARIIVEEALVIE
jgi:hypothetical protein